MVTRKSSFDSLHKRESIKSVATMTLSLEWYFLFEEKVPKENFPKSKRGDGLTAHAADFSGTVMAHRLKSNHRPSPQCSRPSISERQGCGYTARRFHTITLTVLDEVKKGPQYDLFPTLLQKTKKSRHLRVAGFGATEIPGGSLH